MKYRMLNMDEYSLVPVANDACIKKQENIGLIVLLILAFVMLIVPVIVFASDDDGKVRKWDIKGIAVTGPNDVCGVPQWVIPAPFPPDARFTVIGQHDPSAGASNSIALTMDNCRNDVLLATHTDPMLNALGGFADADSRLKNLPLRQVPVTASNDGVRMTLPDMDAVSTSPFPPTKSEPNDPILLGDWFRAKAHMTIKCYADGTGKVSARFKNLIVNGVYSFVATWLTTPPGASQATFVPLPFGGIPNEVVANEEGKAEITRKLNYCPMDPAADGSVIMFVDLGYHTDGSTAGVFPQTATEVETFIGQDGSVYQSAKPPGIFAMPHVGFPLNVGINQSND